MVVIIEVILAGMAIRKKLGRREIGKTGAITGGFRFNERLWVEKSVLINS